MRATRRRARRGSGRTRRRSRIEWGAPGSDYRGWIQISPDEAGSRLTLFLATSHGDASDAEVMGTLDAIRRLVESQL